jgi:hypothetical protein
VERQGRSDVKAAEASAVSEMVKRTTIARKRCTCGTFNLNNRDVMLQGLSW